MGDELDGLLAEYETWLRVERGLAPNSLAAYRRDLRRYAEYLRRRGVTGDVADVDEGDRRRRTSRSCSRHAPTTACAATRRRRSRAALAAVRSFHRFCVEEGLLGSDPSEEVGAPACPAGDPEGAHRGRGRRRCSARCPATTRARDRDRAILETLYAGGLRISELVGLDLGDVDLHDGLVRVLGKGSKERVVPLGRTARETLGDYLDHGRPELERHRTSGPVRAPCSSNARGGRLTRQGAWLIVRAAGDRAGLRRPPVPARAAALVRHPHARPRGRHPGGAGAARPRQPLDHAGVHQGVARSGCGRSTTPPTPGPGRGNSVGRARVGWPGSRLGRWPRRSHTVLRDQLEEERDRVRDAARAAGSRRAVQPRLRRELRRLRPGHRRAGRGRGARRAARRDARPTSRTRSSSSTQGTYGECESCHQRDRARRGSRRCPRRASASSARRSVAERDPRSPHAIS